MKLYAEHKERIDGLTDVGETVKTIEKIAASSVHTARIVASKLTTHRAAMERTLARLAEFVATDRHPLLETRPHGETLLVIATADRGDVGGLWHRIVEEALARMETYDAVLSIGTKGAQYLAEHGTRARETLPAFPDPISWDTLEATSMHLTDLFLAGRYRAIDLIYPVYETFTRQVPATVRLLPFTRVVARGNGTGEAPGFPVFEPSAQGVYEAMLTKYSHMLFVSLAAEAKLAELVARTVAMEHAGAQTEKEITRATQQFRRMRRESITEDQLTRVCAPTTP